MAAKYFIAQATSRHKGAFSAAAKRAGVSTAKYAQEHYHDSGTLGRRARLAATLGKLRKRKKR